MKRFRTVWKFLVPGWLQRGQGELVQWVEGLILDAWLERCHQTAYLMLPSLAPDDALARIGSDRAIPRGFSEPEASYRERLRQWRYPRGHRIRGNAPGLLEQINATFGGRATLYTIDARGTRYTYGTDGAERGVPWDWDGSAVTPEWGRFWLVVHNAGTPWPSFDDGAWGDTIDADTAAILDANGVHAGEIAAVRKLASNGRFGWAPAGRRPMWLILSFDGDPFPEPTGDWDAWPNRDPAYGYVSLHPSQI